MPAPLSKDLRKRVISAFERGEEVKEIAIRLEVSQSAVYCLIRLYKETGNIEPRENKNGRKPSLKENDLINIKNAILNEPDITLEELKDQLGLPVCISALCRTINNKLELTRKKK